MITRAGSTGLRQTWVSALMAVLAGLATLLAATGWWVHQSLLDTDRFLGLVEPVVTSPEAADAIAERVTDEVFVVLDIPGLVEESLTSVDTWLQDGIGQLLGVDPGSLGGSLGDAPGLSDLAPALVAAAEAQVEDSVAAVAATPRFAAALEQSVRTAHTGTVAVLRGDATPDGVEVRGDVVLDLTPLLDATVATVAEDGADLLGLQPGDVSAELDLQGLSDRLGIAVPDDLATVVLVEEDRLAPYRRALQLFDVLAWALVVLAAVFAIATVMTSPRRPAGVVRLGVAVAVALSVTWPVTRVLRDRVLAGVDGAPARRTVAAVFDATVSDLTIAAAVLVAIGLAVALAAWLFGITRRRTATRPS